MIQRYSSAEAVFKQLLEAVSFVIRADNQGNISSHLTKHDSKREDVHLLVVAFT